MLPISVPPKFRIIAHRGASAYAPENTLAAFTLAADMGVHEVELDTQLTTDGVVVLCHDSTLVRYGHGEQQVEALSSAELLALDMGAWFSPFFFHGEPMLTLEALFQKFQRTFTYHVEIKGHAPALVPTVAALIAQYQLQANVIITSFAYDALLQMRAVAPDLRLGWLVRQIDEDCLHKARQLALFQLCPQAEFVTADLVAAARAVTPEVRAWGLGGGSQQVIALIERVLDAGCDGMTINWPDWVIHA